MSRFNKVILTIACICIALSLILSAAAFVTGGNQAFQGIHQSIDTYFGPLNIDLGDGQFLIGFSDSSDIDCEYSPSGVYTVDDEVSAIDVDWTSGSVEFVVGGDTLTFAETSSRSISEKESLRWQVKDGVLSIYFSSPALYNFAAKDLVISVPETMVSSLTRIGADVVSADFTATGFTAEKLIAYSVSGDIKILNSNIETGDFETTSGKIETENSSFDEISAETVSGRVTFDLISCPDSMDIDTVSGSAFVSLPSGSEFTLETDTVSGTVSLDFPAKVQGESYIVGSGYSEFEFDSVSGSLNLTSK